MSWRKIVAVVGSLLVLCSALALGASAAALPSTLGDEGLSRPAATAAPARGTFDALTYNVAGLPEPLSGSEPAINTPLISPLLNDYDLVLVQEDWANPDPPIPGVTVYHELLIADVDHPFLSEPAPVPLGTDPRRPSALVSDGLNRMSRFPFGEITREMWPNCFGGVDQSDGGAGDCLSQKGFSVARTEFAPGVVVDVYNLHAEAGSTPLDLEYSAEDFETLAAFIQVFSAGRPFIVGGDYNLHSGEPVDGAVFDKFLTESGATDVCEVVDCGADNERIDKFVFRDGAGIDIQPLSHKFERDKFKRASDDVPLSDHDALAVTFEWSLGQAFSDVPEDHPFFGEIAVLTNHGVIEGYDDGTFRPGAATTRQAMAAFMRRASGVDTAPCTTAPFPDVPVDHPFCEDISWMVDNDITEGYGDGTFRPGAPVSRQATAAFLQRSVDDAPAPGCTTAPFPDVPVDHEFCPEIKWLVENDITEGYDDGTFRPSVVVTRQVVAAFFYRFA